jgi:hypothetical protein
MLYYEGIAISKAVPLLEIYNYNTNQPQLNFLFINEVTKH